MNTFSENRNDFVGRLLHEGGVSRRTFSAFPENQTASTVPYVQFRSNRVIGRGFLSPAGISWGYSESTRRPIVYQEESPLYRHEIPAGILVPKMAASVIPRFQIPRLRK